jgi:hypothetical protein
METEIKLKDCFGDQGGKILGGESPEECWSCELFERCHKITLATSLQGIAMDLSLITQNGLRLGWLKSYSELDRLNPAPDNS